ncbi:hypothetical protein BC831DRAFT_448981 [Entophlyctis helioformis]|nr:hypothetical protein BC831DRAFT_448981 [Entophlyctis helioformis]
MQASPAKDAHQKQQQQQQQPAILNPERPYLKSKASMQQAEAHLDGDLDSLFISPDASATSWRSLLGGNSAMHRPSDQGNAAGASQESPMDWEPSGALPSTPAKGLFAVPAPTLPVPWYLEPRGPRIRPPKAQQQQQQQPQPHAPLPPSPSATAASVDRLSGSLFSSSLSPERNLPVSPSGSPLNGLSLLGGHSHSAQPYPDQQHHGSPSRLGESRVSGTGDLDLGGIADMFASKATLRPPDADDTARRDGDRRHAGLAGLWSSYGPLALFIGGALAMLVIVIVVAATAVLVLAAMAAVGSGGLVFPGMPPHAGHLQMQQPHSQNEQL